MGHKPVPTKKWIAWLKSKGLEYKRTKASHDIWDYPDDSLPRPVTFRSKDKDIPPLHVHTNLLTLGVSYKAFEREMKKL